MTSLVLDLEGHGREEISDDVDVSRTVGWFTSVYPVHLEIHNPTNPGAALIDVKEQLRQIPNKGIGFGLLRYLSDDKDVKVALSEIPAADVSFNYLGQVDQSLPENSPFSPALESKGSERGLENERPYKLIIGGNISEGRLRMNWSYSRQMYRRETIENLAEKYMVVIRDLIRHCQTKDTVEYTPSDFEDVDLSKSDIDKLLDEIGGF